MTNRRWLIGYGILGLLLGGCGEDATREQAEREPPAVTRTTPASTAPQPAAVPVSVMQRQADEFLEFVPPKRSPQTIELVSLPIAATDVPTIDGVVQEPVWKRAAAITTLDFASQRPIILQAVHTVEHIFFRVTYPDAAPSETHKSWERDLQEAIYKPLPDREDMFVFKWSLVGNTVHLGLRDAEPHRADIWFWKARRTNPSNYADDKWQLVSDRLQPSAKELTSPNHGRLFFRRVGDEGMSAYSERKFYEYQGETPPKYYPRQPQGSRADIRAKGRWEAGHWTIEWARKLQTGHDDDLALIPGQTYLFGVSCYEIAGDQVHAKWFQPLYRAGDVFDRLLLRIAEKDAS
ncbi:MAG: hypothetical protein ETSY1_27970 [Candidatus Entotheonella factor]|uniref:Cytochrome c-552/DMSO reductase-like haem-binding domain-containing protein n=1 Tax=Entotheonella factor TaxID=1429438 RepID=W4LDT3_ENTF1|nr:MAG: hypothetical protein ETSY1_27970 [Candidatus Entotheonella factor]